jgi:hemerythrin
VSRITKRQLLAGVYWIEIPEAEIYMLCGCPADSVKHLIKAGLIKEVTREGHTFENGPNIILLSDVMLQRGYFSNLAEFVILQMFYRQGMLIPDHPGNRGMRPLLIGSEEQIKAQLSYIHRGNYGLISIHELLDAGLSRASAERMMLLKEKFAFGSIQLSSNNLVASQVLGSHPLEIRDGVMIKRLSLNCFKIEYQGESCEVDLNLDEGENYFPPYQLDFHPQKLAHFGVIHAGEGDGWDINRATAGSILIYAGKFYLIDAGPNIIYTLRALGIGISEIEGIFHTHIHDDHFAGITAMVRAGFKLKYYTTRLIRHSVEKKLSALLSIHQEDFGNFFDYYDLEFNKWNNLDGLEVKPLFSPHPVETNLFSFRVMPEKGGEYLSYSHFCDLVSFATLKKFIREGRAGELTNSYLEKVRERYLVPATLKKIDVGGGMVHGESEDFRDDQSDKLILCHTEKPLTKKQLEVGQEATFGSVDILIPPRCDYYRQRAMTLLDSYFGGVSSDQLERLLDLGEIIELSPGQSIREKQEAISHVYLILSGWMEVSSDEEHYRGSTLSHGALVGERMVLNQDDSSSYNYKAISYIRTYRLEAKRYVEFIKKNNFYTQLTELHLRRAILSNSSLFNEGISYLQQNSIAANMRQQHCSKGEALAFNQGDFAMLIGQGSFEVCNGLSTITKLRAGYIIGQDQILYKTDDLFTYLALEDSEIYIIPAEILRQIPIVRWKLMEISEKMRKIYLGTKFLSEPMFVWEESYCTHLKKVDRSRKKFFNLAIKFIKDLTNDKRGGSAKPTANEIKRFDNLFKQLTADFEIEEGVLESNNYSGLFDHRAQHDAILKAFQHSLEQVKREQLLTAEQLDMLFFEKLVTHILLHDHKYSVFGWK